MSGGVDSSVATALLKEQGYDVSGVHIKMWSDPDIPCTFREDRYDAMRVAAHLDIPFQTWDFTEEYRAAVVDYMIREYASGRTPNPDVMCNRHVKFGVFLDRAIQAGADFIATGHYARVAASGKRKAESDGMEYGEYRTDGEDGLSANRYTLSAGTDANKDQSYFLWTLTQGQLARTIFPIGGYTKPEVRELARKFNLPTAEKNESQGICFIGEIDVREFLKKYISTDPGKVLTTAGKVVGEHEGLAFHTIGQRHGLRIGGRPRGPGEPRPKGAGGIPYYVAEKNFDANELIVSEGPFDEKLFRRELVAENIHWVSDCAPQFPLKCQARIRYRQPVQECSVSNVEPSDDNLHPALYVRFVEPQRAVTPGQSIVFYQGDELIGGGIIR